MKHRAILATLLLTGAALAGSVGGAAVTLAADPECRYIISPKQYFGQAQGEQYLDDDQVVMVSGVGSQNPDSRLLCHRQPRWSVVAIRPAEGTDYDLTVATFGDEVLGVSAIWGSAVDFVAIDGNQDWQWPMQPQALRATTKWYGSTTGTFAAMYATGGTPLEPGSVEDLSMSGEPAVIRDVAVRSGETTTIRLRLHSGDADLALVESVAGNKETWAPSRSQAIAHSINPGLQEETITITLGPGDPDQTFGLVVVNNTRGAADYTLLRF